MSDTNTLGDSERERAAIAAEHRIPWRRPTGRHAVDRDVVTGNGQKDAEWHARLCLADIRSRARQERGVGCGVRRCGPEDVAEHRKHRNVGAGAKGDGGNHDDRTRRGRKQPTHRGLHASPPQLGCADGRLPPGTLSWVGEGNFLGWTAPDRAGPYSPASRVVRPRRRDLCGCSVVCFQCRFWKYLLTSSTSKASGSKRPPHSSMSPCSGCFGFRMASRNR